MQGRIEILRHQSRILADNPLHDPTAREIAVYLPPSYLRDDNRRFPVIYLLMGYTGHGPSQLSARSPWAPTLAERIDALITKKAMRDVIVVLPDFFTRYGGSQYVDSPAIGRYQTYFTDEIVPFIDSQLRTIPKREARAVVGKSSGGYGSLILGMARPDVFSAIGSHAGDSAFELCYARELPHVALAIARRGGLAGYLKWFDEQPSKPGSCIDTMSNICCAAAWSPRARGPYGWARGFDLPIDLESGTLIDEIWQKWLAADPVRMLDSKRNLDAMRKLSAIYLDAGTADEYMLQFGTRQVAAKLKAAKIKHRHEEFDAGHMNIQYRYDTSLPYITRALASS